ncbi:2-oxo acid dehydrogenase subunit E2, partial [Salmonella enterica]|uniref:2-oxo acid dehydrogenase subunit E2 n=1 Tax=Salmonella enterica TaxID=28901 RepID=UPI0020C2128A
VSNIGNIGGTYLSPVIVDREVAILGIGRMRAVPAFESEGSDRVVRRHVCNFSWSADHRVVDGATMARAADVVRRVVEEP